MILRTSLARAVLLLSRSKRYAPPSGRNSIFQDAFRVDGGISTPCLTTRSSSHLWMSTSPNNGNSNDRNVNEEKQLSTSSVDPPASRAMVLGNIISLLTDAAGIVVAGITIALGLLYSQQDKLLYIPEIDGGLSRPNESNPAGYKSPAEYYVPFETHMIETSDPNNKIHSWLLLHPKSKQEGLPTIIFFHGNAGNIGIRLPNAMELYNLNANVFLVEYRGYGDSSPGVKPSEAGIKSDCEAALRFISSHPQVNPSRLYIFGRSLGGAVGFHVAQYAQRNNIPLAGLIIENTFVSIDRMVDVLLPFLYPLKGLLLRNHYDSSKIVSELKLPILFLAGDNDEIVPHSQMLELYKASRQSSSSASLHVVKGGMHNDTWLQGGKSYWKAIRDFINATSNTGSTAEYDR